MFTSKSQLSRTLHCVGSWQGPDAHEEEHAVEHCHRQELEHLRKHEGQADKQMDAEVGHALLGHARRLLLHLRMNIGTLPIVLYNVRTGAERQIS